MKGSLVTRFWAKVNRKGPQGCWLWTASVTGRGYGQMWNGSTKVATHRFSWELAHGPIPKGQHICHRCDVTRCVNPSHLFLGTAQDNLDDARRKGRLVDGIGARKLTLDDYRLILNTNARGVDLAHRLGVTETSIARIRMGQQGAVLRAQVEAERRPARALRLERVPSRQVPVVGEVAR